MLGPSSTPSPTPAPTSPPPGDDNADDDASLNGVEIGLVIVSSIFGIALIVGVVFRQSSDISKATEEDIPTKLRTYSKFNNTTNPIHDDPEEGGQDQLVSNVDNEIVEMV